MPDGFDEERTADPIKPPQALLGREDISLLVLSGPCAGRYFKVPREGGVLGRDTDVEISITDPGISRRHAKLERRGREGFVIRDLDSRYGVYVEGERVKERALMDGDRLQVSGETVLRVRYQDAKETEILDRLQEAVIRDPLTGLANRRHLFERLEQEFAFARRHGTALTVLMIDLDHFKRLNDQHGHPLGDHVLATISRTLHGTVRIEDVVARYGGDEIIIISRGYDTEEALLFGERLVKTISEKPVRAGGNSFHVTISVGVATYLRGDPDSVMTLIARADAALYKAKHLGRNRVASWKKDVAVPLEK